MATNFYVVAKRYSKALWSSMDSATEAKSAASELQAIAQTFQQPDLWRLLTSPTFTAADKVAVTTSILEKTAASKPVQQFILYLVKAGRIGALAEIAEAFENQVRESEGVLIAQVETALALNEKQKTDIASGLTKLLGKKVSLSVTEKPEMVAGLRVFVDGRLMDGSLTSGFQKLEKELLAERA